MDGVWKRRIKDWEIESKLFSTEFKAESPYHQYRELVRMQKRYVNGSFGTWEILF